MVKTTPKPSTLNEFMGLKETQKFDGKKYKDKNFEIIYQDSRNIPQFVNDNSVQSIITSPPYGDLRDYGVAGQIGLNQEYIDYLDALDEVWKACFRVLKPSGTFWLNIGHQMLKGDMKYIGADCYYHLQHIGFKLKRIFYWYKRNYASGYNKRNLLQNFEPIYCFVKDPCQSVIYEDQAVFQDFTQWQEKKLALSSWILIRKGGSLKKTQNNPHPASYPDELVERAILISTKPKDIVLDPFLGSGTTTKIARDLGRIGIGFEINPDFYPLHKCRMEYNDDYSSIQKWIEKYNSNRELKHENQKMKNY